MIEIETYEPFPKQQEFHRNPAKYRLFGGSKGPGKSKGLLQECVVQAHEHAGVDTLLLRRTYQELEDSLISKFRRDFPSNAYKSFNESKHIVTWWNGSTTRFGYCRREADVYQYQGAEFVFIGIDELTLFSLKMWLFLTSCNRCAVPGTFPNMAGTTNPGGIGHDWVRRVFGCAGPGERIEKGPALGMDPAEYDPADYAFIPALISDNPIYANDAAYLKTLAHLPATLRAAYLKGLWNVFAGQYFDIWDPSRMVESRREWEIQRWWPKWISIDWGFEHPSDVQWHCIDDRRRTLTCKEYHQNRVAPRQLGREIVERTKSAYARGLPSGEPVRIADVYLSPDAFAKRTDEATIAEQIGDELEAGGLPRPTPADNDRVGGWMLMYQMLDSGDWLISDECPELIGRIPGAIRDETKVEDIAKFDAIEGQGGDDPLDSARYGLKSKHSPGRKPVAVRIEEGLVARIGKPLEQVKPEEYTHVMLQRSIVEQQERQRSRPMRISRRRH